MNKHRLLKLADYLDNLNPKEFCFWRVISDCGTVGCACGHLPKLFPRLARYVIRSGLIVDIQCIATDSRWYPLVDAKIFNISASDAWHLFKPEKQKALGLPLVGRGARPKTVAKLIRAYVEKYGKPKRKTK